MFLAAYLSPLRTFTYSSKGKAQPVASFVISQSLKVCLSNIISLSVSGCSPHVQVLWRVFSTSYHPTWVTNVVCCTRWGMSCFRWSRARMHSWFHRRHWPTSRVLITLGRGDWMRIALHLVPLILYWRCNYTTFLDLANVLDWLFSLLN